MADPVVPTLNDGDRSMLTALREHLHRHPELSWKEERTCTRLHDALISSGVPSVTRVAGTGLVARVAGRSVGAPCVAIRGDIDALPIREATGLNYASAVEGVMHACGHDVHATWAVGAARLLSRHPAEGDVLIVLQPAEELGEGAAAILESGALDGVAAIFGGHVDRRFDVGKVVAEPGPMAASADTFTMTLTGRGAHGARPHEARDPVVAAAAIINALQTIVSRSLDPSRPAVVSVGSVHAGVAANVIPERAELSGTLRAMDAATRAALREGVSRLSKGIGESYGVTVTVEFSRGTPPIVNPEVPAGWARRAATRVLGPDGVVPFGITNMGGEDFAFYMEKIPGCFMRIGAREPGGDSTAAHSPRFFADPGAVFIGATVLAECAREASLELSRASLAK